MNQYKQSGQNLLIDGSWIQTEKRMKPRYSNSATIQLNATRQNQFTNRSTVTNSINRWTL
jgi:hypothetical protein